MWVDIRKLKNTKDDEQTVLLAGIALDEINRRFADIQQGVAGVAAFLDVNSKMEALATIRLVVFLLLQVVASSRWPSASSRI